VLGAASIPIINKILAEFDQCVLRHQSADFSSIRDHHSGEKDFHQRVIDATYQIVDEAPQTMAAIQDWKQFELSRRRSHLRVAAGGRQPLHASPRSRARSRPAHGRPAHRRATQRRDRAVRHPVSVRIGREHSFPRPVHVVEVLDHPGLLGRVPSQPLLRQCTGRRHVPTDEHRHPAEVTGGLLGRE
jgi:hypothetical protein